jgi:hypothetical protein
MRPLREHSATVAVTSAAAMELPEAKSQWPAGNEGEHLVTGRQELSARVPPAPSSAAATASTPSTSVGKPAWYTRRRRGADECHAALHAAAQQAREQRITGPARLRFTMSACISMALPSAWASVKLLHGGDMRRAAPASTPSAR